jgi:hypothetical protein
MSLCAISTVADQTGLTPVQKLIAYQLAAMHNHRSGQCNPSPATVATLTGLTALQVKQGVHDLEGLGIVVMRCGNFLFPRTEAAAPRPVPANFWPSENAMRTLVTLYPQHDFNMEDAVHEFVTYFTRTGRFVADVDRAFVRNIGQLLARRQPGQVTFASSEIGEQTGSVRAFLSESKVG